MKYNNSIFPHLSNSHVIWPRITQSHGEKLYSENFLTSHNSKGMKKLSNISCFLLFRAEYEIKLQQNHYIKKTKMNHYYLNKPKLHKNLSWTISSGFTACLMPSNLSYNHIGPILHVMKCCRNIKTPSQFTSRTTKNIKYKWNMYHRHQFSSFLEIAEIWYLIFIGPAL